MNLWIDADVVSVSILLLHRRWLNWRIWVPM